MNVMAKKTYIIIRYKVIKKPLYSQRLEAV